MNAPPTCWFSQHDVFDFLVNVRSESIDGILTDPPYGTKERHRRIGTTTRLQNWYETFDIEKLAAVLTEFYRVLKPNTYALVMVDSDTADLLKQHLGVNANLLSLQDKTTSRAPRCSIGFSWWTPHVWVKTVNDGQQLSPGMGYHGRNCYELVLVLGKGNGKVSTTLSNVHLVDIPAKAWARSMEARTAKPPKLAAILAEGVFPRGGLILEPFAGSGGLVRGMLAAGFRVHANDIDGSLFRRCMTDIWEKEFQEL